MDGWINSGVDGCMHAFVHGWVRCMHAMMDGCIHGWMHGSGRWVGRSVGK